MSEQLTFLEKPTELISIFVALYITGSPSSKYEHRWASTLLSNIQNIRICMGEKTYRFSTQQCRCSLMLIFRAWTTCVYIK